MAGPEDAKGETGPLYLNLKFFLGIQAIADFLRLHERTVRRLLREPKLPAKKDQAGRWVMVDVDYYLSLRGATHGTREKGPEKDQ